MYSSMSCSDHPLSFLSANQTRAIQEALRPHLRAAGVRNVERRLGKAGRFFQNVRQRGSIRLRDFLAACAALELDPVELAAQALRDEIAPEIRPPRVIATARRRLNVEGPGLGVEELQKLESALQADPRGVRRSVRRDLHLAARQEIPLLLGIYGSALRIESDLSHAAVVLREAQEIARELDLPAAEADLLIRFSYVALDRDGTARALSYAKDAVLGYTRLDDHEGEGRGFLTTGMFQYYSAEYHEALRDLKACLKRCTMPRRLISAHQIQALCYVALDQPERARQEADAAWQLVPEGASWVRGKLSWLDARLAYGQARVDHLRAAQDEFLRTRPGECLLVTVDLVEALLASDRLDDASEEIPRLCDLVERAAECQQVQRAVSKLISHRSRLTPRLITDLRKALDRARDRKLASLVLSEP